MDKFITNRRKVSEEDTETDKSDDNIDKVETSSASSASSELVTTERKRHKVSMVWCYFKRSKDKRFAKCYTCGKEYRTSGNTSNLSDHLKRFHPILNRLPSEPGMSTFGENASTSNESSAKSSTRSISPFFRREQHYDNNSERKKLLDKALIFMIATDFQPFSLVKDSGFRNFVSLLDSRYVLPCPDTLKNKLLKNMYDQALEKLNTILNKIKYVGITTDIWTSSANESYICVSCHFINENFEIRRAILTTKQLSNNHTAENIADCLHNIFEQFKISDKITCIVTDNAANMIKSCELLRKKHLPCFAHTLNLAVQDNFKKQRVIELIKKCKEIVTFFKSSCIAYEKYKEEQQQIWKGTPNEEKTPYKLLQEVPTRWTSVYYMIQRILLMTDALNNTLLKQRNAPLPLSVDDISTLHDIEKALFIFEDATEKISGQKYVTVSLIIPVAYGIYNYLSPETMNTEIGKEFCLGLIDSVRKRLFIFETRPIPRITTILDARFKKEGFRNPENANQAADILEQEMATFILQNSKSNEEQNNLHDNHFIRTGPSSSSVIFGFLRKSQ